MLFSTKGKIRAYIYYRTPGTYAPELNNIKNSSNN